MPTTAAADHDQRLKILLKEFFEQFLLCFFPAWAACFDFSDITWLDKEVFLAPPQGEKRKLDLVARPKSTVADPPANTGARHRQVPHVCLDHVVGNAEAASNLRLL